MHSVICTGAQVVVGTMQQVGVVAQAFRLPE